MDGEDPLPATAGKGSGTVRFCSDRWFGILDLTVGCYGARVVDKATKRTSEGI